MALRAVAEEETLAGAADVVTETMKAAPMAAEKESLEVAPTITSTEPSGDRVALAPPAEVEETQGLVGKEDVQATPYGEGELLPQQEQVPPRGGGGQQPQEEDRAPQGRARFLSVVLQHGWRIAEVVLGLALVGLVMATIWKRTRF
jgi:hypothetical protein